jgi:HPt (histidine-containing phosphotransfer) domain-containing protein
MGVNGAATGDVLDVTGTLNRFGGDADLFREMGSIVLADAPKIAQTLSTSIAAGDANGVQAKAHAIKGLVIGCGGILAGKAAQVLEDAGRDGKLDTAAEQFASFRIELERFLDALRAYSHAQLANEVH